jgi:hypothetical protein
VKSVWFFSPWELMKPPPNTKFISDVWNAPKTNSKSLPVGFAQVSSTCSMAIKLIIDDIMHICRPSPYHFVCPKTRHEMMKSSILNCGMLKFAGCFDHGHPWSWQVVLGNMSAACSMEQPHYSRLQLEGEEKQYQARSDGMSCTLSHWWSTSKSWGRSEAGPIATRFERDERTGECTTRDDNELAEYLSPNFSKRQCNYKYCVSWGVKVTSNNRGNILTEEIEGVPSRGAYRTFWAT